MYEACAGPVVHGNSPPVISFHRNPQPSTAGLPGCNALRWWLGFHLGSEIYTSV